MRLPLWFEVYSFVDGFRKRLGASGYWNSLRFSVSLERYEVALAFPAQLLLCWTFSFLGIMAVQYVIDRNPQGFSFVFAVYESTGCTIPIKIRLARFLTCH